MDSPRFVGIVPVIQFVNGRGRGIRVRTRGLGSLSRLFIDTISCLDGLSSCICILESDVSQCSLFLNRNW